MTYICATYERFLAVTNVLKNMVNTLVEHPSPRLLKHIVRCYLRLSDNARSKEALRSALPDAFRNGTLTAQLRDDRETVKRWMTQLLMNLQEPVHSM